MGKKIIVWFLLITIAALAVLKVLNKLTDGRIGQLDDEPVVYLARSIDEFFNVGLENVALLDWQAQICGGLYIVVAYM